MTDIVNEATRLGGVVRTRELVARGFDRYEIDGAVRAGLLRRPRRGWIAAPRADPMLADSGAETIVVDRLRWLKERILQQVVLLDRPVDILIGDRLVIQVDGGHHVGAQRAADIEVRRAAAESWSERVVVEVVRIQEPQQRRARLLTQLPQCRAAPFHRAVPGNGDVPRADGDPPSSGENPPHASS